MEVLLLLLEELRPEGNITLDNGRTYTIDDDGLAKLRRLVVRSLSKGDVPGRLQVGPGISNVLPRSTPLGQLPSYETRVPSTPPPANMNVSPPAQPSTSAQAGFHSRQIALITVTFLAVVGIAIMAATWLAVVGKISDLFVIFILGAAVIGAFSVIHRYASAFKQSIN